ncbi:unnamed protein product [Toxocara canis]|uniref:Uncharacterized protein n=1 Tax=Toxocara canis TaxID=6265 RepID=A0A183TZE5_TOXCA|nr:unnamed protein product [Toxocara canis]
MHTDPTVTAKNDLQLNVGEDKPKKKATKGEDMLDLLDEATRRPPTAKKSLAGSRSGSTTRDGSRGRTPSTKRKT